MSKYSVLFFFIVSPLFSEVRIQAWRHEARPSLILTDKNLLTVSDGGLRPSENEGAFLYVEEMPIPLLHRPRNVFASFSKEKYNSHIIVQVMDAFTDEEVFQIKMYDPATLPWQKIPQSDRIYLVVRFYGKDITLRSVGMISEASPLAAAEAFIVEPARLYALQDTLSIQVSLSQDSALSLYLYDSQGRLVKRLADKNILPQGHYTYYWDPTPEAQRTSGEDFIVWMQAEHADALPVEMTRTFRLIP